MTAPFVPKPGDYFHVPGDTALVHEISVLLMSVQEDYGSEQWLVRATDGSHWILAEDESLDTMRFRGRRAEPEYFG